MKKYWPNFGENEIFTEQQIEIIEQKMNAIWIADLAIKNQNNQWSERPVAVFWQWNPDISKGHHNLVGFFREGIATSSSTIMITSAQSLAQKDLQWAGIEGQNGEICISAYRHDFKEPFNPIKKGDFIDGGRDYTRSNAPIKTIEICWEDLAKRIKNKKISKRLSQDRFKPKS